MNNYVPSMHDAFNARTFTIHELCNSFIVSDSFTKLCGLSNTVMIGPRGSGKTTLMRMLSVQAIDTWDGELADYYRKNIPYSGVFIPTDRVWKSQYEKVKDRLGGSHDYFDVLDSLFIYHVLERFISALSYRASRTLDKKYNFLHINISKKDEADLVKELSESWMVNPSITTFKSLEVALIKKKQIVSSFIYSLINKRNLNEKPEVVSGDITDIIGNSVDMVNVSINDSDAKWCFLFDELELAPDHIVQPLIDATRGRSDSYIFKLALSPYHENVRITDGPDSSMNNQDFSFVNLTGSSDRSGLEFSKQLCANVFIRNELDQPIDSYFDDYVSSILKDDFIDLANKDSAFRSYLGSKKIDIDKFDEYTDKDKRTTIRKIQRVVRVRNAYLKANGKPNSLKRPPDFYGGFENICKSLEYNPRMLIGIMNGFVPIIKENGTVPIHNQIASIVKFCNSYRSLLSTIAIDSIDRRFKNINDLIDCIGRYFQHQVHGEKFESEPKGSLTFNQKQSINYKDVIGVALNAGALISIDNVDAYQSVSDITNVRCRLSFIFAHHYRILLIKQRAVNFQEVLKDDTVVLRAVDPMVSKEIDQLDLL